MELGETRVEKATRFVGDKFDGIEWHVYRMGHLTDYYIGTVRNIRRVWVPYDAEGNVLARPGGRTRKAAIDALCKHDDIRPEISATANG